MPPTTEADTSDRILAIRYEVNKPTLEQILAIETITPVLGPTATVFMIQCGLRCRRSGVFLEQLDLDEVAAGLGVGVYKLTETLKRLVRFHVLLVDQTDGYIIDRWPADQRRR